MKSVFILLLVGLVGCAEKYVVPGTRFLTPEAQGGKLKGQFEFQQNMASQHEILVNGGTTDDGVDTKYVSKFGFLWNQAVFDRFDFYWSHTGEGNSLLGGKFQFLGDTRSAAGHKLSLGYGFGGNEFDTNGATKIDFTLKGQEWHLLYGYRFSDMVLLYSGLNLGRFNFSGKISSSNNPNADGLKPNFDSKTQTLLGGTELSLGRWFAKLELGYQKLQTTNTKDEANFIYGYSGGFSW